MLLGRQDISVELQASRVGLSVRKIEQTQTLDLYFLNHK
jgi:hypothetical protein